ncbi:MAG: RIP metalloprotease RseP [Candidatus Bipolaricaulota bacterium]|nr:RIP metalloprotease RseP [Candidatus Bipolaricaulota bacterium]MDW8152260.1 RIP metalloprotease RseP [Candidatus Bipolaricaulota bacterium]
MSTLALFLVTILVLVGFHELGHFLAAKLVRIGVVEFAIGFGPPLRTWKRGKTRYSLRLLPLGGYVRLAGEGWDPGEFPAEETYYGRPAWARLLVALLGPAFNLLLALVLAFAGFGLIGLPRLRVAGLVPGRPAEQALQVGDVLLAVEGRPIWSTDEVGPLVQARAPEPVRFHILREGRPLEVALTPVYALEEQRYLVGAYFLPQVTLAELEEVPPLTLLSAAGFRGGDRVVEACGRPVRSQLELLLAVEEGCREVRVQRAEGLVSLPLPEDAGRAFAQGRWRALPMVYGPIGLGRALRLAGQQVGQALFLVAAALQALVARRLPAGEAVSGPVGIAALLAEGLAAGPLVVLLLIAVISVNLALFNLLPIPALDGSRLLFALVELLTRRRVPPQVETLVHTLGFVLLLGLLILITARDLLRLFG